MTAQYRLRALRVALATVCVVALPATGHASDVLPTTYANGGWSGVQVQTAIADVGGLGVFVGRASGSLSAQLMVTDGTTDGLRAIPGVEPVANSRAALDEPDLPVFGALGTQALFAATDADHGTELWTTDGTPEHTRMLRDIWPGPDGGVPRWFFRLDNQLLFSAVDAEHGMELWRTDGTEAGTTLVSDIVPGSQSSYPNLRAESGGQVFFLAQTPENGEELWRTDGTTAGTRMVTDFPGTASTNIWRILGGPDVAYFMTDDSWWRTDGTAAGTWKVLPVATTNAQATMVGDTLYALMYDAGVGRVWRTDGTHSDPSVVMTLSNTHEPQSIFGAGHALLISDGDTLFCSNGSGAEPTKLLDLTTFGGGSGAFASLDGAVYLRAGFPDASSRLVETDGTTDGTHIVAADAPPMADGQPHWPMFSVANKLMFPDAYGYGSLVTVGPVDTVAGTPHCDTSDTPPNGGGSGSAAGGLGSGASAPGGVQPNPTPTPGARGQDKASRRAVLRGLRAIRLYRDHLSFTQRVFAGLTRWRLILQSATRDGLRGRQLARRQFAFRTSGPRRITLHLSARSSRLLRRHERARLLLVTQSVSPGHPTLTVSSVIKAIRIKR